MKREENLLIGFVMATLAFASLALMGVFAKAAAPGSPAQVNVFFQNAVAFVVLAPFALRHGLKPLRTRRIGMHVLRAFSGSASWLALFIAINLMPLTNAVLLAYSAPIILPLIAWLVTRQRITGPVWIGVVLGFVGIALVLHPSNAELGWGAPIALFGAVMVAMALLSVRWLSETEPDQRIMFFYFSISTLMTLPLALIWWQMPEVWAWPYIVGIGLSLLASQVTIIIAYRYATPVILAPTIYLVIIFTALIDWAVWDRQPTWLEVGGMALVIVGGIIAMRKGGNAKHAA
ncbi:MAG: DMT family transporter [Pseudomonadota bacterium]